MLVEGKVIQSVSAVVCLPRDSPRCVNLARVPYDVGTKIDGSSIVALIHNILFLRAKLHLTWHQAAE